MTTMKVRAKLTARQPMNHFDDDVADTDLTTNTCSSDEITHGYRVSEGSTTVAATLRAEGCG
jgi:hypothetical protein